MQALSMLSEVIACINKIYSQSELGILVILSALCCMLASYQVKKGVLYYWESPDEGVTDNLPNSVSKI